MRAQPGESIWHLEGLSVRGKNALIEKLGYKTIEAVARASEAELTALPGFGRTSLRQLKAALKRRGFTLAP